ncbi:hypothetical protein AB1399_05630 [Hydrogenibacillus schlegelii]|uniref:Uncharacterized protein n=1 Tax=Hydrogenibacillus schlegelii TaxID=1484 RepID=A0A132N7G7_HYDSH|nr:MULTISPECIES: hypothetical protein [Hydrogenibacillus]KWX06064.1 hypothetical protein TR75_07185 [Hydrogenibacillus schlegelii]MBT9282525.1 hypothetical protein [Hydrogenibacillus schlegelii]OAR04321.1 hypothetical protein SA87_05130 [Hydrogenibacillus schlegelii]PTQ52277.1 MAG: hypothetical protein HSCHL_0641 [Hydrogenibacillus schlegelii]QZA33179.1 hypothetical protein K2M58_00995 [Hydrogenibacillus sp. N12]
MKLDWIEAKLKEWGEVILRLDSGETLELHLGDTTFDHANNLIHFRSGDAIYYVDAEKVESLKMHLSHFDA